jgi:2-phosphosulfolactate phosphatase
METQLEVILTPAEFAPLKERPLGDATCVVFDILRATTSMLTALAHGAHAVIPVEEISDAVALRARCPDLLLAGERNGHRIRADLTGGIDFDLGNSPREYTPERVRGRTIVTTTTNGTRAIRASVGAQHVLVAAFLNLDAVARWIARHQPQNLVLVCSGTHEELAYEDLLAAGGLLDLIWPRYAHGRVSDSATIARQLYRAAGANLLDAMSSARNGRRLLSLPDLAPDVPFCVRRDTLAFVALLDHEGKVVKHSEP